MYFFSFGTGRCSTSAAPTSEPDESRQPIDSERHSDFTAPQAGVCRKLAERCPR